MAKVLMPQKKDPLATAVPVAGAVVGGVYGGPGGAMAGYSAGSQAYGTAKGFMPSPQDRMGGEFAETSAMDRRMSSLEEDPLYNLRQAKTALAYLPPEQQKQYGPVLDEAYQKAAMERRQGVMYG